MPARKLLKDEQALIDESVPAHKDIRTEQLLGKHPTPNSDYSVTELALIHHRNSTEAHPRSF